ncbi:hypothetical protein AKO1_006702 [Acrasis kona]|uniref:Uncharacterized protein n=1 Tax=Acrasis kona TaxID=1008807 RepID=A0AAW2YNQ8_9EUKA
MPEQFKLSDAPLELKTIEEVDKSLEFTSFTVEDAWSLGTMLRSRLLGFSSPAVVDISLASSTVLFHTATKSGVSPDNDSWVARKKKTVLRFNTSTWFMHNKFQGNETSFAAKYGLGETAGQYAIHGGGWPVKVKNVEGVVAVIVVSGLKQDQDHQIIVQTVKDFLSQQTL